MFSKFVIIIKRNFLLWEKETKNQEEVRLIMVAMVKEDLKKVPNLINPLKAKKLKTKRPNFLRSFYIVDQLSLFKQTTK